MSRIVLRPHGATALCKYLVLLVSAAGCVCVCVCARLGAGSNYPVSSKEAL